jgi:hypothetical protein
LSSWSKASSGGKCKKRFLHFLRQIERTLGSFDDFLRMLGFPLCFSSSGLFGTTFGQSGGFSTRLTPALGFGVFLPWNVIIDGPSDSAPHVPMYHYSASLSFYHTYKFRPLRLCVSKLSRLGRLVFSRQNRNSISTKAQPQFRDQQKTCQAQYYLLTATFPTCFFECSNSITHLIIANAPRLCHKKPTSINAMHKS